MKLCLALVALGLGLAAASNIDDVEPEDAGEDVVARRKRSNVISCSLHDGQRWANTIYWDDKNITSDKIQTAAIANAMKEISTKLSMIGFKFIKARGQCEKDEEKKRNCLYFTNTQQHSAQHCNGWTPTGRSMSAPHKVFVSKCPFGQQGVMVLSAIMTRETFRAFGARDEINRFDRDNFLKLVKANIPKVAQDENKFKKNAKADTQTRLYLCLSSGTSYDLGSLMQFDQNYMTKNGKATIQLKQRKEYQNAIGRNFKINANDLKGIMRFQDKKCKITGCLMKEEDGSETRMKVGEVKAQKARWSPKLWPTNMIYKTFKCTKTPLFDFYHAAPVGLTVDGVFYPPEKRIPAGHMVCAAGNKLRALCPRVKEFPSGHGGFGIGPDCPLANN